MIARRAVTGSLLAATLLLTGCTTAEQPELSADQLHEALLSADDIDIAGLATATEHTGTGEPIQPGMGLLPLLDDSNCADAVRRGTDARIDTRASASRSFSAGPTAHIAVGAYAPAGGEEKVDPARLYGDVLTYCTEPIVHQGSGFEYMVDQLSGQAPEVTGMVIQSISPWGEQSTNIVMQQVVGDYAVALGATGVSEQAADVVFADQVAAIEELLER